MLTKNIIMVYLTEKGYIKMQNKDLQIKLKQKIINLTRNRKKIKRRSISRIKLRSAKLTKGLVMNEKFWTESDMRRTWNKKIKKKR